jgi:hypothetical protein
MNKYEVFLIRLHTYLKDDMDYKKLDSVRFGNQPQEYVSKIKADKYGTLKKAKDSGMISEFIKKFPPPKNSSGTTKKELEYLKKISSNITEKEKSMCFYKYWQG